MSVDIPYERYQAICNERQEAIRERDEARLEVDRLQSALNLSYESNRELAGERDEARRVARLTRRLLELEENWRPEFDFDEYPWMVDFRKEQFDEGDNGD